MHLLREGSKAIGAQQGGCYRWEMWAGEARGGWPDGGLLLTTDTSSRKKCVKFCGLEICAQIHRCGELHIEPRTVDSAQVVTRFCLSHLMRRTDMRTQ